MNLRQGPPSHFQEVTKLVEPTERHNEEPRGRKRHSRSRSEQVQGGERVDGEVHHPPGPPTPKRGFLRATSRRRQSEPPSEGILHSAKRLSRDFLASPWKPGRDDKHESERYQHKDQDQVGSSRGRKIQGQRQVTRPTTPSTRAPRRRSTSRAPESKPTRHGRRPSQTTCPQTPRRNFRAQSRNSSAPQASPVRASAAEDITGDRPQSRSDLSDLDGNRAISKMNGLLDIWDSTENQNWERETFPLCDLEHCRRCGKYYVPMRTLLHKCRRGAP